MIRTIVKGGKERVLAFFASFVAELGLEMRCDDWWFLTPRSLRYFVVTDLVEVGVDIRVVRELMAHEDLSATQMHTLKRDGIALLDSHRRPASSGPPAVRHTRAA
ncbi:tyrosine-type recombinase/integrase [Microbacterium azadirachtae]|uniref:tyrosine-type recombinase/integrase n=1 Tax=Microbacterium azadirachtae TaxID=582680 RepID=UPI003F74FAB1